jgi:hypothetical protein
MLLAGSLATGAVVTGCSAEADETEESGDSRDAVVIQTKGAIGALNASLEDAVGTNFTSSYPGVTSWTFYQTEQGAAIRGFNGPEVVVFVGVPKPAVSGGLPRRSVQSDFPLPAGEDDRIAQAISLDYNLHSAPARNGGVKAKTFGLGCLGQVIGHIGIAFASGSMAASGFAGVTQGGGRGARIVTATSVAIHAANYASYLNGNCI